MGGDFTEDTEAFLDYYYSIKTAENEIFVMEEDQTIRSMLQLNPYRLRVNKASFSTNYIIAVATDEKYRNVADGTAFKTCDARNV